MSHSLSLSVDRFHEALDGLLNVHGAIRKEVKKSICALDHATDKKSMGKRGGIKKN